MFGRRFGLDGLRAIAPRGWSGYAGTRREGLLRMSESIHRERTASEPEDRVAELIEQQMAVSEVLRAIAGSPSDLQPIFDTILANATRLCRAEWGRLTLFEGSDYRVVSIRGLPDPHLAGWDGRAFPVLPGSPSARLIESKLPVHVADVAAEPAYREHSPEVVSLAKSASFRTYLLVPMLKEDELIGAMGVARTRVQPFTDAQIDLITDFAAEATVALESTRRERRYREMQMELARVNRVATIGQLTASITHEVNQPLAATRNNLTAALNFLNRSPPDLGEVREALACAVKDNDRASTVVGSIRALMQKAPTRTDSVDLNAAVRQVLELIHGQVLKHEVSVRTQLADGLLLIHGDRVQLQQVVLNLILNAVQAMDAVVDRTREVLVTTGQTEPNAVWLGVQDAGSGLSAETLPRLFEPFYTTKPGGMGMGLAICRSIIEAHGGRLWATRCEPRGALFQFTIPAA
jgi:signal transduction histidine kinase